MKTIRWALILLGWFMHSSMLLAQDENDLPDFNKLRTPSSPGFVLLGVEPSNVERPSSPQDLTASVSNRTDNFSTVPENFALEFSPYWLVSRPELGFSQYAEPGIEGSILQTASVSLVTSTDTLVSNTKSTSLAAGLRFSVFRGHLSQRAYDLKAEAKRLLEISSRSLASVVVDTITKDPALGSNTARLDKLKKEIEQTKAMAEEDYEKVRKNLVEELPNRQGFVLEVALAGMWHFADRDFGKGAFSRWGIWLTPAFNFEKGSLVTVIRYIGDRVQRDQRSVDFGARVLLYKNEYAFSLETVKRFRKGNGRPVDQYRIASVIDYKIAEKHWLTFTFGRNFNSGEANSLLAQANVSFGFGQDRSLKND